MVSCNILNVDPTSSSASKCPVESIFEEDAVPDEWKKFININYDYFGREYEG